MTASVPVVGGRVASYDILRLVGVTCVILAHSEPPAWLFQLRNFDVPLLVMLSGATAFEASRGKTLQWSFKALWDRALRLLLPTWLFLSIFFLATTIVSLMRGTSPFDLYTVITSYSLTSGIGYVWIIRVFLLIAVVTPYLLAIDRKFPRHMPYLLSLAASFVAYEATVCLLPFSGDAVVDNFMQDFVYILVPYGLVFCLGARLPQLPTRYLVGIVIVAGAAFAATGWQLNEFSEWVQTQTLKHPPHIYYLSYAVALAVFLYGMIDRTIVGERLPGWMARAGSITLWVYLWHILGLYLVSLAVKKMLMPNNYLIAFGVVLTFAFVVTLIQRMLVTKFLDRVDFAPGARRLVVVAFLK